MGNLGAYETFTTQAGEVGGVDNLIKIIEKAAVSKSAPSLIALGLAAGVGLATGGYQLYRWASTKVAERGEQQTQADEAKENLRLPVETADPDNPTSSG